MYMCEKEKKLQNDTKKFRTKVRTIQSCNINFKKIYNKYKNYLIKFKNKIKNCKASPHPNRTNGDCKRIFQQF